MIGLAISLGLVCAFISGMIAGAYFGIRFSGHAVLRALDDPKDSLAVAIQEYQETKPFAVAGKPRREPWSVRKRELAAKERTKRKQMEEYR